MFPRMVLAVCFGVFSLLAGCDRGGGAKTDGIVIAVIPRATPEEYWKLVHAGVVKAGHQLDVRIEWAAPANDDPDEQGRLIEQSVKRGVGGILVAPMAPSTLNGPVHRAVAAGIPVIAIDSVLFHDDPVSFITADEYKAGHMGGEYLATQFKPTAKGKPKIIMLHFQSETPIFRREAGFLDAMKAHTEIEFVTSDDRGGATTQPSYDAAKKLLARFRDDHGNPTIDGAFCPDETTTTGMLHALTDAGWTGKVKFVGCDASPELEDAVEHGPIQALVVEDPVYLGEMSVKAIVGHLQGGRVDKRIDIGATLVTADNLGDPKIDALFHPDPDRWLNPQTYLHQPDPQTQPE